MYLSPEASLLTVRSKGNGSSSSSDRSCPRPSSRAGERARCAGRQKVARRQNTSRDGWASRGGGGSGSNFFWSSRLPVHGRRAARRTAMRVVPCENGHGG